MALRILIADDHQIVRQGTRALLERAGFQVVGEAEDGRQAVTLAAQLRPEVVVLDVSMPLLSGREAAIEILRQEPQAIVILLTMHDEEHQVATALRSGVRGYVLKTQAAEDLVQAIHATARGQTYLSPRITGIVVDRYLTGTQAPVDALTPRERQVLQLIAEGKTTKEIAEIMGLSPKTAESYRARVMEKLDIHSTAGLVRYAIKQGLVDP